MKARLIGLALLVGLAVIWEGVAWRPVRSSDPATRAVSSTLLPTRVGDWRAERKWGNGLSGGVMEQGALYSRPVDGIKTRVDLLLRSPGPHNALFCYLIRGTKFTHMAVHRVQAANSGATFDVALVRSREAGSGLRLVAATECSADGCTETGVSSRGFVFPRLTDLGTLFEPPSGVVPVAIDVMPTDSKSADPPALRGDFRNFVGAFDLRPIERVAAHQGG